VAAVTPLDSGTPCVDHHGVGQRDAGTRDRPAGQPIYVILDNLSANKTPKFRTWAAVNNVELCLTPTNASWANPIEAQFGPCAASSWAPPTTPTTPSWPPSSRNTDAGATPTPATPTS
jgi:DDE superfamily endonuclease